MVDTGGTSVLCVGLVCVDIVTVCDHFPSEDTDQRAQSLHWQRGGNAASTSVVLANLQTKAEFFGSVVNLASGRTDWNFAAARFALQDLTDHGVETANVKLCDGADTPTSLVTVNSSNGSRTIIHHRGNLEELKTDDFSKLNLAKYHWIHFEGRPNVQTISDVIQMVEKMNKAKHTDIKISVELEKPHVTELITLCKKADLVFLSKEYAAHLGYGSALEAVKGMKTQLKEKGEIICTWGSVGAAHACNDGTDSHALVNAIPPEKVVDTIGAGDAFIGGVIHCRSKACSLPESVRFGCRVSERKITGFGFDHVVGMDVPDH